MPLNIFCFLEALNKYTLAKNAKMDSSGTLKTTISLGKNPSIVHSGPFYLMKEPPTDSESITGATNLMGYYGLEHSYSKFSGKKMKEQLSSFLPNLPMVMNGIGNNVSSYYPNVQMLLFYFTMK
jgi:mediator of RNA polymerase II transcription subunit 19